MFALTLLKVKVRGQHYGTAVKPPHSIWVPSWVLAALLPIQLAANAPWGSSRMWCSSWISATHMEDFKRVPGSWTGHCRPLGSNQCMKDLSLPLSVIFLFKSINQQIKESHNNNNSFWDLTNKLTHSQIQKKSLKILFHFGNIIYQWEIGGKVNAFHIY